MMFLFLLEKHWLFTIWSADGITSRAYYYYDAYTWVAGAVALLWLLWLVVRRYRQRRAQRRPPLRSRVPKGIVKIKSELSARLLQPGVSNTIHAVGIGKTSTGAYCIDVFLSDARAASAENLVATLPANYRGVPLLLIEMPVAGFLSEAVAAPAPQYQNGIREQQEVIVGGISGANTNLAGQSGTIGYFCTRKSRLRRRKEIHLLSNSHVFVDLARGSVTDVDLIMQPSPGERSGSRPIGALVDFSPLKFDGALDDANHVDAAIAKLWDTQPHQPLIPLIGTVRGFVLKQDIEVGEAARKFGRTTGYTEGNTFSIHLDIWIRYDRTGKSAFFKDQILVAPVLPAYTKFAGKGDSGSLVLDDQQRALGLLFAGMAELPDELGATKKPETAEGITDGGSPPPKIEGYGVANPISEVLDRLRIDLLI